MLLLGLVVSIVILPSNIRTTFTEVDTFRRCRPTTQKWLHTTHKNKMGKNKVLFRAFWCQVVGCCRQVNDKQSFDMYPEGPAHNSGIDESANPL